MAKGFPPLSLLSLAMDSKEWRKKYLEEKEKNLKLKQATLNQNTFYPIGFWHSDRETFFPHPRVFIGEALGLDIKEKLSKHIANSLVLKHYRGASPCRICNKWVGSRENTDGLFIFPEGFAHYISEHDLLPPKIFLEYALGKLDKIAAEKELKAEISKLNDQAKQLETEDISESLAEKEYRIQFYVNYAWWLSFVS